LVLITIMGKQKKKGLITDGGFFKQDKPPRLPALAERVFNKSLDVEAIVKKVREAEPKANLSRGTSKTRADNEKLEAGPTLSEMVAKGKKWAEMEYALQWLATVPHEWASKELSEQREFHESLAVILAYIEAGKSIDAIAEERVAFESRNFSQEMTLLNLSQNEGAKKTAQAVLIEAKLGSMATAISYILNEMENGNYEFKTKPNGMVFRYRSSEKRVLEKLLQKLDLLKSDLYKETHGTPQ